jgi:thioesterase domain-containing protein/acyl carrier protein
VPVGPPIANTQFYILNRSGGLLPPGMPGELHIGGDGVARGYFERPDLTSAAFIPDEFRPGPHRRLYRTGDIVRLREGGQLEFMGRRDYQVKLRGFRIELGDVEQTLLRHPNVNEAVVALDDSPAGEPRLHAYVKLRQLDGDENSTIPIVRNWASRNLPSYMVPDTITILSDIPRTPNGKVDRRALPPARRQIETNPSPALCSNTAEARLSEIWQRVLGPVPVSPNANFFDLGGNSLTATRLLAQIEVEFERKIQLATLFQSPTLRELALLVSSQSAWQFDFTKVVRLQSNGRKPTLIALNNIGSFYKLSRRIGIDHPFTALQLFDPTAQHASMPDSLESIAREYVRLIRDTEPEGPYILLGWCVAGAIAFEVANQLTRAGHNVALVVMVDAWAPGYTRRLPPVRAWLATQSYRWQTLTHDVLRVARSRWSAQEFLYRRRALRWLASPTPEAEQQVEGQRYHAWLLKELLAVAARYDPPRYPGRVLLLRADEEPRGAFLDPTLGWGEFVSGQMDNVLIPGDHSSIFEDPGVQAMADCIKAEIARWATGL